MQRTSSMVLSASLKALSLWRLQMSAQATSSCSRQFPSNASITSIKLASDDLDSGTTLTANVGLYTTGGVVADVDAYASVVTDFRAATAFTEFAFEARDINKCGQKVWEDAGATADPKDYYYVAVTFAAAGDTAGDFSFQIEYIVN
jgi:hypothetical protein